jgi:hypothetical protein
LFLEALSRIQQKVRLYQKNFKLKSVKIPKTIWTLKILFPTLCHTISKADPPIIFKTYKIILKYKIKMILIAGTTLNRTIVVYKIFYNLKFHKKSDLYYLKKDIC